MMILLPGILSQGAKRFVWKKYSLTDGPVAGTPSTVKRDASYRKRTASAYTFSGTTFSLTSSQTTYFNAMKKGNFLVDIANNSTSTRTTGTTLYELTSDASSTLEEDWESESGGYYYHGEVISESVYTNVRRNGNQFEYVGSPIQLISGSSLEENSSYYEKISSTEYRRIIVDHYSSNQIRVDRMLCSLKEFASISYTPYTIQETKGEYIEDVVSKETTTYPDNGIQDGYWYVRIQ